MAEWMKPRVGKNLWEKKWANEEETNEMYIYYLLQKHVKEMKKNATVCTASRSHLLYCLMTVGLALQNE